jgi:hypothetical protein
MAEHRLRRGEGAECPARSNGNAIAAGFMSCRSRLSQEFAPDRL